MMVSMYLVWPNKNVFLAGMLKILHPVKTWSTSRSYKDLLALSNALGENFHSSSFPVRFP